MTYEKKPAVLVVSFGTSHQDTREKTIDAIENTIRQAFPTLAFFRAWTSKMILHKLQTEKGIFIPDVRTAMEQMKEAGITDVFIQPTHVINGIENQQMEAEAMAYRNCFHSITLGTPLVTTTEDSLKVVRRIAGEFSWLNDQQALVLMGHGTAHFSNFVYAALNYTFQEQGYSRILLGTVEAYPSLASVKKQLAQIKPKEVILAPFMIVAGDHAKHDMAGPDEDSWASQLRREGYQVQTVLKGLGEYEGIRNLFLEHLQQALSKQPSVI